MRYLNKNQKMWRKQLVSYLNYLTMSYIVLLLMFCIYFIMGVHATISNFKFILYLFILHEVLQSIHILSTELQLRETALGRSGNLIKGIISK